MAAAATDDRPYANTSCPHCGTALDPLPRAKRRCPACRQPIYVRSGPDGLRHLLGEADLPAMERAWEDYHEAAARAEAAATNRRAAEATRNALRTYAEYGVPMIELLGADDSCPACRRVAGHRFRLADAPTIPIDGCSNDICRCDYVPVS